MSMTALTGGGYYLLLESPQETTVSDRINANECIVDIVNIVNIIVLNVEVLKGFMQHRCTCPRTRRVP